MDQTEKAQQGDSYIYSMLDIFTMYLYNDILGDPISQSVILWLPLLQWSLPG